MVVLRLLAILCCANLALPPGWCSIVFRPRAEPPAPVEHHGCCDLCARQDREKPPPPAPKPVPPARCCCYELDWLKPPPPVSVQADCAPVIFIPTDGAVRAEPSLLFNPDQAICGPSPPLHVLHCVWLC